MLMKRKAQKIKQILPITDGLFTKMNYAFPTGVTKANLDLMFISNYGMRNPSPIVETIQGEYGEKLTSQELTQLASSILEMYKDRWDKLSGIYGIEYDPIHNYLDEWEDESEEVIDGEGTSTSAGSTTYGKTQTETIQRTDNLTERSVYEEDTNDTRTDDLTKTETRNLADAETRTDNLSESTTYGRTDTRTDNLSESRTYGKTDTRTDNLSETTTYGRTDTRTDNLTETKSESNQITDSGSSGENVFAFNSSAQSALPVSTSTSGNTHTETLGGTTLNTGTETVAGSGSDTKANTGTSANVQSGSDGTTNTGTQTNALSGSDTRANTGTRTTSGTNTGTVTTADDGTVRTVGEKDSTRTTTNTGTRTTGDQLSFGGLDSTSRSGSTTEDVTKNRDRSGRHFGNIGNLTSQKQILEEINLWKWNYMNEILSDVKDFCTLPVYLNASEWQLVDQDDEDEE